MIRVPRSCSDSIIIKLGGSVITHREGDFDTENAHSLAREIVEYGRNVVIVHGGGSYTKRVLLKHQVESDFLSSAQRVVIEQFREAMKGLNDLLLGVFESAGLECVSIASHTVLTSDDGEIVDCNLSKARELLMDGITPVLFGDVLVDRARGYYACSGDQIASHLARILRPKMVLFLTDVDGVYEHYPPESDQTKPLPTVDVTFLNHMHHNYEVGGRDMYGKIEQAIACTPFTELCCILNGRVRGNLVNVLQSRTRVGTKVT